MPRPSLALQHSERGFATRLGDAIVKLVVILPARMPHATEAQRQSNNDTAHQQTNQYSSFHISS
jgi:hypothetical protein